MVRAGDRPNAQAVRRIVSPETPSASTVAQAALVLRKGGLVAFPTDTLYALGTDAANPTAIERIFTAKGRGRSSPIPLLVADLTMAIELVGALPDAAVRLAQRYWPGPVTLIVSAPRTICTLLTAGTDRIGLRVPDAAVARALIRQFGGAVTGTSANRSGGKDPLNAHEVLRQLGHCVDLILDGGPVVGGRPSTIVDVTVDPPIILRQGPISQEEMFGILTSHAPAGKRTREAE